MVDVVASQPRRLPRPPRHLLFVAAGTTLVVVVFAVAVGAWRARQEAAACRTPTATLSTDHPLLVGSATAPTVGPIALHPAAYESGSPTKTVVEARTAHPEPITLSGYNCHTMAALHFWYRSDGSLPSPGRPLGEQGTSTMRMAAGPAGDTVDGYLLFATAGDWLVTVRTPSRPLGAFLIDVAG
jgi:hypothetical protein